MTPSERERAFWEMTEILRSKNLATRFQILVEIATSQPNIQQRDIAKRLDITPQAVSEHIRELVREGSLISDGRSRYRLTKEGVNWVLKVLRELQSYSVFIGKAVTNLSVCAAVADCDLAQGQSVGLEMKDGLLFATSDIGRGARGVAVSDTRKGEDVGVSGIEGIVDFDMGKVTICRVPGIQGGGSGSVDLARLKTELERKVLTGAVGIEALITLRKLGLEADYFYGVEEVVVEAVKSGLSFLVVCVDEETPRLLKRLEEDGLSYELLDFGAGG